MKILSDREYEELLDKNKRLYQQSWDWESRFDESQKELHKIQDWIRTMLENNGYKLESVPYYNIIHKTKENLTDQSYTKIYETIIIPELRIVRTTNFRDNYMNSGD